MRLFAQLSWYFRREWRRYLGAIALLAIIAVLQLIPPKVVGIVVDGVTQQHYTAEKVWMWIGALVLVAVMVYLLRYVWRQLHRLQRFPDLRLTDIPTQRDVGVEGIRQHHRI
ncbi:hypothetical protein AN687_03290, partial [Klebsiella variicola]